MRTTRRLAVIAVAVVMGSATSAQAATAYNAAVLASNPTYYWTFDEPDIEEAEEQVNGDPLDVFIPGLEADPKIPSTTTAGGVSLGLCLDIFGLESGKLWDTGDLSGDPFAGAWAYEIWINSEDPESYQYIMGSQASNGYNSDTILQYPYADTDKGPKILIYDWGGIPVVDLLDSVAPQTAGWHHWVFVSDGFSQEYDVYQDGAFLMTALTNSPADAYLSPFPALELRAGGWNANGSLENFTGQIDEFAIYDLDGVDDLRAAGQAIADHYFVGATITGDYDASGQLDVADLDLQAIAIAGGQNPLAYDLTGDELVNFADRQFWVDTLKRTWIGDANLDGEFTSSDMVQVFVRGKYETNTNAGWEDGDWNADLKFGSSDMVAAFAAGGYEQGKRPQAAVSTVPEPSGVVLVLLGLAGLLDLTRRREC